jgi:hypothetical protein
MRHLLRQFALLGLSACGSSLPASESPTARVVVAEVSSDEAPTQAGDPSADAEPAAPVPTIHVPALSAEALIADAGLPTFLEDHGLRAAVIDGAAMERWFTREPSAVFLYAERSIDLSEGDQVAGACQRVARVDDIVTNQVSFVLSRRGSDRVLLEIGQERVDILDQRLEGGRWDTGGVRPLPLGVIAWDEAHVAYAESAEIHEVACVHTVRHVLCDARSPSGPRGHCLDQALVVRPWRAPTVPHVGDVIPAYPDPIPRVPQGACEIECAPSACSEALARARLPRVPLYADTDRVLAVFRTQAACRAFARSRTAPPDSGTW